MLPAEPAHAELDRLRRRNEELEAMVSGLRRSVRELESFAWEVSHELKAPLTAISGYNELLGVLAFAEGLPAEVEEFRAGIGHCCESMSRLIDGVLEDATDDGGGRSRTTVDLTVLVADVVAPLAGPAGPASPVITWEELPAVLGDELTLRRVLHNLLGNAVKYVRHGEVARVHVSAGGAAERGMVRIEVTDQGVGIPDGQHEAIFRESHRAHADGYPGTGLGLAICRRLVSRLGGRIGADVGFRGGARIWFTVPAASADLRGI